MKHWSCGLKQESIPNTMVIQGTPDGSGAWGGGDCRNLRGQAYLHIRAGILLLVEIGVSLRFPNIRL